MARKTITAKLKTKIRKALAKMAEREEEGITTIIHGALEQYLKKKKRAKRKKRRRR